MKLFARPKIAVVEIYGFLSGGYRMARMVEMLNLLKESRRVKAVILHVDSPGGTAGVSSSLYWAISRLSARKPVVAFIGGVGASGAYLASCSATKVVAVPQAIIGSIGVISIRPLVPDLLQKLGVQIAVTKSGQFKDMGAFYRLPTEDEKRKEQELVDQLYQDFVSQVAKSRKLDPEKVKQYATGEVFLASQAKEWGLVDEVGDWDRALEIAAELAKVPARVFYARPRRPLAERLLSRFALSLTEEVGCRIETMLRGQIQYTYYGEHE